MHNLKEANLRGKRVLYRPDYNVPMKLGEIQDPFRITATFPTLDYLIEQGAKIIIATHLGRPGGHVMEEFSLRPIAEYLADHYPKQMVCLASQIYLDEIEETTTKMRPGDILVLPNLRFFEGEELCHPEFGRNLAALADLYVNDAFANAHRSHASMILPPQFLPSYPGFLLEQEVEELGKLLHSPEHPFVVIMGGAKVIDKIEILKELEKVADTFLIGGALANTFLLAQGEKIGNSKAEPEQRHLAEQIMHQFGSKLFLATDFVKEQGSEGDNFRYLDIGEKSIAQFKERLSGAKTVFWNGPLGYIEEEPYDQGSKAIAEYLAKHSGTTIVAGGEVVELVSKLNLRDQFTFVSTGGGASLDFISKDGKLPALIALEESKLPE